MKSNKKVLLVFGCGELQKSIINVAHKMGLYVVGIDPCEEAYCKKDTDVFEVVGGQDYEGTCHIVEKYGVDAIVTAATDKPLIMMARIAQKYGFPFFSVDTAIWSTDKYMMKQRFQEGGIPCAKGQITNSANEIKNFDFPVIVKPRDNSGSRGVKLCSNLEELQTSIDEALSYSHLNTVLVEEFIDGQEYSIEGMHYDGKAVIIQFTEKTTSKFPYNVELTHKQPANLSETQKGTIRILIEKIGNYLQFENCPSHTELKINAHGIFVIETSPRLGGGTITSHLVPLSTGINMEEQLIHLALGEGVNITPSQQGMASGVKFLELGKGIILSISPEIEQVKNWRHVVNFQYDLKENSRINFFKNGLDRYGHFILQTENRHELDSLMEEYNKQIKSFFIVK